MGEHTIREILKRRSPETQRAMQRRRELASGGAATKAWMPKAILVLVLLGILAAVGYLGYIAHGAGDRFLADKASQSGPDTLSVTGTTEFLPNTLLAALDPAFYGSSGLRGAELTHRLLHLYYPQASGVEIQVMAVALEAQYPKTAIMEALINDVPLGGDVAHPVKGLGAASVFYFGKPFAQLAPQDIALLVALMKEPTLDPRAHPDLALSARNDVLQADLQQNVLSQAQVDGLSKLPLDVIPKTAH